MTEMRVCCLCLICVDISQVHSSVTFGLCLTLNMCCLHPTTRSLVVKMFDDALYIYTDCLMELGLHLEWSSPLQHILSESSIL